VLRQPQQAVQLTSIRVLVADSDQQFRSNFVQQLQAERDITPVGEAKSGSEVLLLAQKQLPDVVVLDLHLPHMDGVEVTYHLQQMLPQIKILILAERDHPGVLETIRNGASGSLLKEMQFKEMLTAIRVIAYGGFYIHPLLMRRFVTELRRLSHREKVIERIHRTRGPYNWHEILTYREMEVLRLLVQGKNNRMIGEHLYISEKTVKNHVSNILHKLHVRDRTQAVLLAIRSGWVQVI
jgi:two-component system, NarL family, response regulator DegU